ncbi:MAG: class I SAM-dependent methyltransferase [Bradyrhizobiaceae bacterium]|nr:class I SAM-dependent methyltransferase [Bradyrhizobiaceae bacterium]
MTHYVSDAYKLVAEQMFQRHYELPIRAHAERYTFFEMLGDCSSTSVLELACGEGWYPRQMKRKGAARVLGVDLSVRMIEFAKLREQREPLGVEYRVADMTTVGQIDQFDFVTAQFMFNYPSNRDQFQGACNTIAANLKPGGRFVCMIFNPFMSPIGPSMRKYGVNLILPEPLLDGEPIAEQVYLDDGDTPTIENTDYYYWAPTTYITSLNFAGMTDVRWHAAQISPEGLRELGAGYWADFLKYPSIIGITAVKG